LTINRPRSSKKSSYDTSSFLKVSLIEKNLEIDLPYGFVLLFDACLSSILLNKLLTYAIKE
jgi:hypothetical protein